MTLDIMLPFWGSPEYLYAAVESVLAQDSDEWRLVVIDDLYPDDGIPAYFDKLQDPRVSYVRNERNLGVTGNFERCVELATADYMNVLGCDDLLHPNYVSTILAAAKRFPEADIIQPGVTPIDAAGEPVFPLGDRIKSWLRPSTKKGPRIVSGEHAARTLLTGDWLYWPSLTFKRKVLEQTPFRHGFPVIQDLAMVVDILVGGGRLLVEPTICFSYRRHDESASGSGSRLMDGTRFEGERDYLALAAQISGERGWRKARMAAKLRLTSRLHAVSLLPKAIAGRDGRSLKALTRHAFGS